MATAKPKSAKTALKNYRQKRDFTKTAEPSGDARTTRSGKALGYLIQKHAARRLHYDFRLELDGVLKSWAVTRGPSLDPADKRLAVHVEDHPVDYGSFEGTIPAGEYGGGTVMLWDTGTWQPLDDPHKSLSKGHLRFTLMGKRLKGEWHLIRMRGGKRPGDTKHENWLLVKGDDRYANTRNGDAALEKFTTSVTTGMKMDAIAAGTKTPKKTTAVKTPLPKNVKPKKFAGLLPDFIELELATLVDNPPAETGWIHEIKFDGYRALARIDNGGVRLMTRNRQDWTGKFAPIATALEKLGLEGTLLDGEIVATGPDGEMTFSGLQRTLSGQDDYALSYYVFDLLFVGGQDIRHLPLHERKKKLRELLPAKHAEIRFSDHFDEAGKDVLHHSCQIGLEGIISKRADAPYRSGRHGDWVKSKCLGEQELVVGGYTTQPKHPGKLAALLIGYYDKAKLRYGGKVGTGFDDRERARLMALFKKHQQKNIPFDDIPRADARGAGWIKPELVAQIGFTEWTDDGRLRHPVYKGIREDKKAKDVHREIARRLPKAQAKVTLPAPRPKTKLPPDFAVTHPDKILYPDDKVTKGELAAYYQSVAIVMLPYLSGRPLSLLRCPDGIGKQCFFQRHAGNHAPDGIHDVKVDLDGKQQPYFWIDTIEGLMALVQLGSLEIHQWPVHVDKLDQPDTLIFDLDPGEDVPFSAVRNAAGDLRDRLKQLKLKSFLKTTGGHGLHVVTPLAGKNSWAHLRAFAETMAGQMAAEHPDLYTDNVRKLQRKGRIYIDYLRNNKGASAIALYSTRARKGVGVALPLPWNALAKLKSGDMFTIKNVAAAIKTYKNPWPDYHSLRQSLPMPD